MLVSMCVGETFKIFVLYQSDKEALNFNLGCFTFVGFKREVHATSCTLHNNLRRNSPRRFSTKQKRRIFHYCSMRTLLLLTYQVHLKPTPSNSSHCLSLWKRSYRARVGRRRGGRVFVCKYVSRQVDKGGVPRFRALFYYN